MIEYAQFEILFNVILSVVLEVVPGVKDVWDKLTGKQKQAYMLLFAVVVAVMGFVARILLEGMPEGKTTGDVIATIFEIILAIGRGWGAGQVAHVGSKELTKREPQPQVD